MKPTVQQALTQAVTAATAHPAILQHALDELADLFWEADRLQRNGGLDPREEAEE